jgi:threonine dehydrogenase-like Zn-dependent dehydrogenase
MGVGLPGGIAGWVDAPAQNLYALDPSLSALQGSMTEPFAVCVRGSHLAGLRHDSCVLVLGAGSLGLISALLARDVASRVAISTRYPHQAEAARQLGVEPVDEAEVLAWGADNAPDVVIEQVGGAASTMDQAVQVAAPRARIVVVGLFSARMPIDLRAVVNKELTILGSKAFSVVDAVPEFRAAAGLLSRYRRELAVLQTHQYALPDASDALTCAADKHRGSIKVTVVA